MKKIKDQDRALGRGRIIGLDLHPATFSASAVENTNAQNTREIFTHHRVEMEKLESWYDKHALKGDLFVMEAGSNSFETAKRLKAKGGHCVVLESFRAGQIGKSYLKDDKVDARKIARIYLSGLAVYSWFLFLENYTLITVGEFLAFASLPALYFRQSHKIGS